MLETRRLLLEARLLRARAVADQFEMLSELVLCCGLGDLEALQMLNAGVKPAAADAAGTNRPTPSTPHTP